MSDIHNMGMDAFAEALAEILSDDPDKQVLIQEGLKLFYSGQARRSALPINESTETRFCVDIIGGRMVLWDFHTLSVYMGSVTFSDSGAIVQNARTGGTTELSPHVANAFLEYLIVCIPGFAAHCRGRSGNNIGEFRNPDQLNAV